ncbi:hypothetical protein PL321_01865 [Caloramator sp. mosi_1]|uniref:hypothetical protein n=1 Tax=Caloramator sp. mosi_1 TaxID=3023090 RepID=UPI00236100F1|nr:hypothetical protein [Caloramator sp. mosi_1]WDC83389.1 hypothetical protein PL321_11590 [Caloramator sp. mosi_1]WDC83593.1 hypothetical protein PL321_13150 [Caloramator sp. mosi_1]WDC84524.1 hypothetical protein PL321_01865 [Caloramator sp. mosi_1]
MEVININNMDKNKKLLMNGILEYTNYLKLTFVKSKINELLKEATLNDMSYEEFLYKLLQGEYDRRLDNLKRIELEWLNFHIKISRRFSC